MRCGMMGWEMFQVKIHFIELSVLLIESVRERNHPFAKFSTFLLDINHIHKNEIRFNSAIRLHSSTFH